MNILDIAIAKKLAGGGGGSGTDNYNDLSNLPKINDTTLSGNKSSSALGLQSEINSDSKLASDLVDDTNQDNKFVTSAEKTTWNGKQNAIDADHKISADYVDDSTSTNKFVTASDKETWNAKQNAIDNSHKLSSDLVDDANKTNKFVTSTEKQTWNAKQNAIDADHKLSSSLVSFTDAEAAALASGIDSSKVGQISTNQTNILYALETGANNLCPESQLTIISNSKTKSLTVNLPAGIYYISCNATLAGNILADGVLKNSAGTAIGTASGFANGANVKSITIADTATVFYFYSTDANASFDNLMIVPKVVWNAIDHNFRTAAISNADLTKLEAEDRAGLIECVDEGAKNIFKTFEASEITTVPATIAGLTFIRNADGSITLNGTNSTGSDVFIKIGVFNYEAGKEYVMGYSCIKYGNVNKAYAYSSDDYLASFYDPVRTHTYSSSGSAYVYIRVASDYRFVNATIYPMICIKAKYDISANYESHALPNTDLTQLVKTKAPALSTNTAIDSGSLDDVAENTFAVYASTVANVPTSDDYYVETIVYDASNALQKAYNYTDGTSYVRVKNAATWGNWKQITNA